MSEFVTSSVHGKGHTCLAFSKTGQRVFTGGQDCIVRIWNTKEGAEQNPSSAAEAEGPITCLASVDDYWFAGSDDSEVRRYLRDTNEFDAPLTSIPSTAVRHIAVDPKGKRVAVASDEMFVKVVDIEDPTKILKLDVQSNVRSSSWHPSGQLLAICTGDGRIIVWNTSTAPTAIEKTIEGVIPAVRHADSPEYLHSCMAVWHTSGNYFFIANKGHEIITIDRSDWSKKSTYSDPGVSGAITALAVSPNGVYLASASQSKVTVWSTDNHRVIISHAGTPGAVITQIHFAPKENLLAWTDSDGVFTRWRKPIPESAPSPFKPAVSTNASVTTSFTKTGLDLFDDTPDSALDKDIGGDDIDLDDDMGNDWIVDDMEGAMYKEPPPEKTGDFVKEMVSITKAQPAFQPGSTPFALKKRYLAHNMIGVVEVTDQETHHIVNVDFFDKSRFKSYHFSDNFKYNLAYIGERGIVFACQPENDHPSEVLFKPHTTWKSHDWTYTLTRKGTRCIGVAAGAAPLTSKNPVTIEYEGYGTVVVATSENDLTFLSGTGRERRILALPGEYVTMAASDEWVFVVHRAGSTTIDGSQNLHYTMINFEDFSVRQRDILPVPKGHTLKWIGISDQGAPVMYDSTGCVNILTKYRIPHHASWARILDTNLLERREGKDESYWPVGISGNNLMSLILKGRQEHPSFPRPLIQELPLCMPFRREAPQEEFIEREMLHIQTILDSLDEELTTQDIQEREKKVDTEFIKLIQVACRASNTPRALELTKLLHHSAVLDSVMKIADFYSLPGFKEKVQKIKDEREEAEDRLIVARNKRRRWLKPDAAPRQVAESSSMGQRFDPLGDTRPPPPIDRPGMARVTVPVIEPTRFSALAQNSAFSSQDTAVSLDRNYADSVMDSPPQNDGKRKRVDLDDFQSSSVSMPPPRHKPNPFARKTNQDTSKNPFARKPAEAHKLQKSESFFEKVDAAESEQPTKKSRPFGQKTKGKDAKDAEKKAEGPRQTTLFGMVKAKDKKSATPAPKAPSQRSQPQPDLETQAEAADVDSQMTDLTMDNADETQESFETIQDITQAQRREFSPDWDETQLEGEDGDESGQQVLSQMVTSEA